jgi:hypothetical protein
MYQEKQRSAQKAAAVSFLRPGYVHHLNLSTIGIFMDGEVQLWTV